ncbi:EAL domain-containing protein [Halomonas sp. LR3S48]|uniref:putative bifunctional diguanylate cyclase/phosphodiesterase n=1 Tax=Halomonas sp. LR3S48 TaxID=2982694 RepID=UPI0021E48FE1|nr:EAL domain-containing protein [Halomonas sp. LR3S48]UYG02611.1 EAL domain-containing protein [Halomonas sp. LR3S48]
MSHKTLDIARNTTLYMAAAVLILMGGAGLLTYWLEIVYPLRSVLLPDNALAVLMVGVGLLAIMARWSVLRRLAGLILLVHVTYLLMHNALAGGREVGVSWLTGDVRMGSLASAMLLLVAVCLLLGVGRRSSRWLWAGVGTLLLSSSFLALLRLFLPGGEVAWTLNNASSPLLGTVLAMVLGVSMLLMPVGVDRPQPLMGRLALACGLFGVLLSCAVWYLLNWEYQEEKQRQASHLLDNLQYNAEQAISAQLLLGQYVAERLDSSEPRFDAAMRAHHIEHYFRDSPGMQALVLRDRGGSIWEFARNAPAGRWLEAQLADPQVELRLQFDFAQPWMMPADREQRHMALVMIPLPAAGHQLLGSIDLVVLLREELRVQLGFYMVRVLQSGAPLLEMRAPGRAASESSYPLVAHRHIGLPGGLGLTLEVYPDSVDEMLKAGLIPGGVALAGLMLSYLMSFSLGLAHQRHQDRRVLAFSASHDPLTGLANRTLLEERLNHNFTLAQQRRNRNMAVLFVDLDDFKPINDSLGHAIGDKVLIEVARRLSSAMRPGDTLGRLGGDEFVILMPDATQEAQAEMAESLLQLVAHPYSIDHHELHLSASIGIAISNDAIVQPMELIQQADMAMYMAKQQGRNAYQWFTQDITARVNERLMMRNELQDAIDGQRLELYYQPLYDQAGDIVTVEALLRWNHPARGFVPPSEFIPLAEETGQIMPISRWVLERACLDMGLLDAQGHGGFKVAVNVSPLQFHRAGFLDTLRETLATTQLPASRLELELTEGVLLKDAQDAVDVLHDLRRMGINVSIDDFGTGFSSLNYLKQLPISKVKIDRSFIKEVTHSVDDASIVQAIISMAHHLGLTVVAEGVETEQQHSLLRGYGCEQFQGFLLARPMPLDQLELSLRAGTELSSEMDNRD